MQVQQPSSLYTRAVGPATQGVWRGQDQAATGLIQTAHADAKDKPVSTVARDSAHSQQQESDNEQVSSTVLPTARRLTHEDIVQQQRSASQFGPTSTAEIKSQEQNKRRTDASPRQRLPSYTLASYTGHRANLAYLDMASIKQGRVVDELV